MLYVYTRLLGRCSEIKFQPERWSFWHNLFHRFLCSCEELALLPFLSLSLSMSLSKTEGK